RLTNVELAEKVHLSPSPCLRRVRRLESSGVIRGYHAELDRRGVGLELTVFVGIKVERHHEEQANAFRHAVVQLPEVVTAHLVSGES
ncbi:Lrp/AsnC family transcriptional regulator, partial [Planococcus sp. SIMBA_160]